MLSGEEHAARIDWLRLSHHRTNARLQEDGLVAELLSFVEENCIVFGIVQQPSRRGYDPWDEECRAEHDRLHASYVAIVERSVSEVLHDLGITREELVLTLRDGIEELGLSSHPLDAIEEVRDAGAFRRMMVARNLAFHQAASSQETVVPDVGDALLGSTKHRDGAGVPDQWQGAAAAGGGGGGEERRVLAVCRNCESMVTPPAGAREYICGSCHSIQVAGPSNSEPHVRLRGGHRGPSCHSSPNVYCTMSQGGSQRSDVQALAMEFCQPGGDGLVSQDDVRAALDRTGGDVVTARASLATLRESMQVAMSLSMETMERGGGGGGGRSCGGLVHPEAAREVSRESSPDPRSTDSFIARADFSETSRTLHDLVTHAHSGGVVDVSGTGQWEALQKACKRSGRVLVVGFSDKGTEEGRSLAVVMDNLAIASPGAAFVRVDTRSQGELAMVCGIESLPAVQVYKLGALLDEMHAPASGALYDALQKHVT